MALTQDEIIKTERECEMNVYPKREIAIVLGSGEFLVDANGKKYIDCISGIGVATLGHCHPAISSAIAEQANKLITCPEILPTQKRAEFLQKLSSFIPKEMGKARIFLCNSGAEANEAAMKLARANTGRKNFIAMMNGYHGKTMGSLSITFKKEAKERVSPLIKEVAFARYGNADDLSAKLDANTAAVFLEAVQGEGGVRAAPKEYLQAVRALCTKNKTLLVIDEVQAGYGRTGKMFAFEHSGITPDIICIAKPIAGGIPMGAIIVKEEFATFRQLEHTTTFGGNPLACAAGSAVLDVYEKEKIIDGAREKGEYFMQKLLELQGRKAQVREVRGLGLMLALELKIPSKEIILKCLQKGLLVLPAGEFVVRILPPLIISRESIDTTVSILNEVLQ